MVKELSNDLGLELAIFSYSTNTFILREIVSAVAKNVLHGPLINPFPYPEEFLTKDTDVRGKEVVDLVCLGCISPKPTSKLLPSAPMARTTTVLSSTRLPIPRALIARMVEEDDGTGRRLP